MRVGLMEDGAVASDIWRVLREDGDCPWRNSMFVEMVKGASE